MPSFFDKLRNSMGIEEEDLQEEGEEGKEKKEKSKKKKKEEKPEEKEKKVEVKSSSKDAAPSIEEAPDWFEPEGELAVDVYQTEEEVVIQSTIAGVKPENLDISIEEDTVTISGERQNVTEEKGKNYFYQECFWGGFSREIILPEEVDGSRAEASMADGVFTLRIPKSERKKVRKVKVRG